jgi:hypothetical protein
VSVSIRARRRALLVVSVAALAAGTLSLAAPAPARVPAARDTFAKGPQATISDLEPTVGDVVTARTGKPVPTPDRYRFQWLSDGEAVTGATKRTYTVRPTDMRALITVRVTALKAGYRPARDLSPATYNVAVGGFTTPPVATISGVAAVGETLTAGHGTVRPKPDEYEYQWFRGEELIDGATGRTYVVGPEDLGLQLAVRVNARRDGFYPYDDLSGPTAPVAAAG